MNRVRNWYNANKDVPLFKAKLLLVFLIILAIAVNYFCNVRDRQETAEMNEETSVTETVTEETDKDFLAVFIDNSKAHLTVFLGLSAALAAVKHRDKQKLKESK